MYHNVIFKINDYVQRMFQKFYKIPIVFYHQQIWKGCGAMQNQDSLSCPFKYIQ